VHSRSRSLLFFLGSPRAASLIASCSCFQMADLFSSPLRHAKAAEPESPVVPPLRKGFAENTAIATVTPGRLEPARQMASTKQRAFDTAAWKTQSSEYLDHASSLVRQNPLFSSVRFVLGSPSHPVLFAFIVASKPMCVRGQPVPSTNVRT
jgi:hypothetical protein